jgi:hypothetical protein
MFPGGCDENGRQAVMDAARFALGAEGLEGLRWECFLPPGSAGDVLPLAAVRPSLRRLSYKVCGSTESLQYLLSCHAPTLEDIKLTLPGDYCGVLTPLAQLPHLFSITLHVEGRIGNARWAMERILRAISTQLRCVRLRITGRCEDQLVEALSAGGRAAVMSLDLSGPLSAPSAWALSASLSNLLLLKELRLHSVAIPSFLHLLALPGGSAHRLQRLELAVPAELCPHIYAHFGEVQALLHANNLLIVALRPQDALRWPRKGCCGVCVVCVIGCHATSWRPNLGLLEVTGQNN